MHIVLIQNEKIELAWSKKVKFRPVRSGLKESMHEVKEVETIDDLKKAIIECYGDEYAIGDIELRYVCYDARIKWDTWRVVNDGIPSGYLNGPVKGLKMSKYFIGDKFGGLHDK